MERYQKAKHATIPQGECPRERIESTLATILASEHFRTSSQCRELLQYIVTHTLIADHGLLKERVIGVSVFGRKADYDPASDPIVRVRASDVRKRLAQFYQGDACLAGMARIDIPIGGYHATFRILPNGISRVEVPIAEENVVESSIEECSETSIGHKSPSPIQPEAIPFRPGNRAWLRSGLPLVVLVTVAAVSWIVWHSRNHTPFDDFWDPAFASTKAITIYNAENPAYRLPCATQNNDPGLPGKYIVPCQQGEQFAISDLIPVQNQFIAIGDGYATALLCGLFARKGKAYQLRVGSELSFVDLRYSPAVLIGAFNNAWTLETTRDLKFVFSEYPSIRERGGQNRVWTLSHLARDGKSEEDYAIVSRVFSSYTGQFLIAAAGITQNGTRAAGEFLTSRDELEAALKRLPSGWAKRNIQFVIHTQIVQEAPARPTVVASCSW